MEVTILKKAMESIIEQGVLGTILIILFMLFKKFIERLFKLVENNTEAMTKNAEAIYSMKKIVEKCDRN